MNMTIRTGLSFEQFIKRIRETGSVDYSSVTAHYHLLGVSLSRQNIPSDDGELDACLDYQSGIIGEEIRNLIARKPYEALNGFPDPSLLDLRGSLDDKETLMPGDKARQLARLIVEAFSNHTTETNM